MATNPDRAAIVAHLKAAQSAGRATIADAFAAAPFASRQTTRAYAYLTDCVVRSALQTAQGILHPNPTPTRSERMAVLAVGGYGRGEMAPFSDVDLLFLTPYKITPWAESVIESTLYILWDLKLKVGHSSRTVADCLRLGAEDFTIRTAMLEHRFLFGDAALGAELDARLRKDLFQGTERDFIEAKLAERDARHKRQGQRYVVEPNVKEGKGGLRDLQSLFWIGKYIHKVQDAADLVPLGLFTEEEFDAFVAAEDFLWAVRCHLHLLSGRATEQLTFDMQVAVAEAMNYDDKDGRRAVEVFMQDYFLHATEVGDLTRIFLTKLEAIHLKAEPLLDRLFKRKPRVKPGYEVIHNRLAIEDEA
ncbi:MAG: [protein-PII] uridylyltransferase, partial [Ruegeria sp.]